MRTRARIESTQPSNANMTVKELQNKGVFTDPEHHLWLEELEVPNIKNDECLVHVRATG